MWRERAALALAGTLAAIAHADATAQTAATRELVARAVAYEHGEGDERIRSSPSRFIVRRRSGDPDAQFGLGWMYANGRGLPRDDRLAAGLFALAAAQRHEHAQRMLSVVGEDDRRLPECLQTTMPAAPARRRRVCESAGGEAEVRRAGTKPRPGVRHPAAPRTRGDRGRIELRATRALAQGRAGPDAAHSRHGEPVQGAQRIRSHRERPWRACLSALAARLLPGARSRSSPRPTMPARTRSIAIAACRPMRRRANT